MKTEKHCPRCNKTLPIGDFYKYPDGNHYSTFCRPCIREDKRERYKLKDTEKYTIPIEPGDYTNCEHMREDVSNILSTLGWMLNEVGIWYKPGIKESDGTWTNIKVSAPRVKESSIVYTKQELKIKINELLRLKLKAKEVAEELGCSVTSVYNFRDKKVWK